MKILHGKAHPSPARLLISFRDLNLSPPDIVTVTLSVHAPVIVNISLLLHPRLLLQKFLVFSMISVSHLSSRLWIILWILILQSLSHSFSLLVFATRSIVWN